jgi:hypothetical protein
MTRLLIAAALLMSVTAPAFACGFNSEASTDAKSNTVASQPATDQSTPPPTTAPATQSPS